MIILVFGATGSAGGSVLGACIHAADVAEVRAITRRPLTIAHPKLLVVEHADFLNYSAVDAAFASVDACFFCIGVSAAQVSKEAEYQRITRDYAVAAARALLARSPNAAFHFVSGMGTRPNSRIMWSRVKAEAERELMDLAGAVCYRPGAIDGEPTGSKAWYAPLRPLFKVFSPFRGLYVKGEDLGRAMLQGTRERLRKRILENSEIRDLADRSL